MPTTNRFAYRSLDDLLRHCAARGMALPASADLSILASPVRFGLMTMPNRLAVQPMEGCDGDADGRPGELTFRRYARFAAGGAGLIWFEACAVVPQGRANPRQLWLHKDSAVALAQLVRQTREAAQAAGNPAPAMVLQLTHSGRYSRPGDKPAPIIAHHSPVLDGRHNLPPDCPLITDDELDELQDAFVRAAMLAAEAGFDGVDIKSCHRYLLSELLASHTRDGRYGGSYEGRTRMLRETMAKVRRAVGSRLEVTCRLNAFDAIAYPYGWGVDRDDYLKPELSEPLRLIGELVTGGMRGLNVSVANPYHNPHVNRPADWMIRNWPDAPEHPLTGVLRIVGVTRDLQLAFPDTAMVASGYSWLRHYLPQIAAGVVARGWASLVGLGRGALAYPDFARDILRRGVMDPHKVCVACSSCTQIMRDGGEAGCVVRDAEVYGPIFRRGRRRDSARLRELASLCRRCPDAMCATKCPAGVDIPGFIGALSDGDELAAYRTLRQANLLPETCAAVCPVEVQCQSACIRALIDEGPVPIAEIQAGLSHLAIARGWAALAVPLTASGKRVAIIGAGPAGLAAAATLVECGHSVDVFDRADSPGGKAADVIPPTRLPPDVTRGELDAIFANVPPERLRWHWNRTLGRDLSLDHLAAYDALVLAVGVCGAAAIGGPRPLGVIEAGEFLAAANAADRRPAKPAHAASAATQPALCPPRVAVLGGGNTAADAAAAAARHGATDVYLVYRRGFLQMPAWPLQRQELLNHGVHLMLLCLPLGYVGDAAGRLTGIRIARTVLGGADSSGRRQPRTVTGSEFVLEVDQAIEALGESLDADTLGALQGVTLNKLGGVRVDERWRTTRPGLWAAGDAVSGGASVAQALAEGRQAAMDVNRALCAGG